MKMPPVREYTSSLLYFLQQMNRRYIFVKAEFFVGNIQYKESQKMPIFRGLQKVE